MTSVFFSYSHRDEDLRNKLEAHLSVMRRNGDIDTWHDRRIAVGEEFGGVIDEHIKSADVILLLVSSDFLNSDYCYEIELDTALERHAAGEAKVIPVILRPCDWQKSKFGGLLAAPKDGLPVVKWPDLDDAMLDVVEKVRNALPKGGGVRVRAETKPASPGPKNVTVLRSSNLRVAKRFTDADKDRHLNDAFEYMANLFENSIAELANRNPEIEGTFRRVDANSFTGVLYRDGKSVSRCRIRLGGMFGRAISFAYGDTASDGTSNEEVHVETDDEGIYLKVFGMASFGQDKERHLTFEGAAEYYWDLFVRNLQ